MIPMLIIVRMKLPDGCRRGGTVSVMGSETISALNNLTDYEKAKLDEYFLNRREEAWKRESPSYQNKFSGNLNRIHELRKCHHGAGTY